MEAVASPTAQYPRLRWVTLALLPTRSLEVIELRAADLTLADGLDLLNGGSVDGEHLFHTDAIGDAAHGDGLLDAAVLLGDDGAFEDLDTLAVSFLDMDVNADGVAHFRHRGRRLSGTCC